MRDISVPSIQKLPRPIRVMIVDDAAIIRSVIEKFLKSCEDIDVCGFASNGEQAVQTVGVCNPDVVLLDIEMPIMDGITAIPLLLEKKPDLRILMCSTLSERGADISLKALSLGATDCILKPSGGDALRGDGFAQDLIKMVRGLGASSLRPAHAQSSVVTRAVSSSLAPQVIAIGSSTGGPQALPELLKNLQGLPVPIVVTQHMPKTFTAVLAKHLSDSTNIPCAEGENGAVLEAGKVYIAPGGYHMTFKQENDKTRIVLDTGPMENFCKPSVDPMIRSLLPIYKSRILFIMLTGMGDDGLSGVHQLADAKAHIIAQDEESSVVWGMPGAIANAGLCNAVLPLGEIAGHVKHICRQQVV